MKMMVPLVDMDKYELSDLGVYNRDYDLDRETFLEWFSEGDRVFENEYPEGPVQVAVEPEGSTDPEALAVFISGKKIGYIKKERIKDVLAMHHQDVRVYAQIDGGPVKFVEDGRVIARRFPYWGKLIFTDEPEQKEVEQAPPAPLKPKTLPPVIFYVLGALLLILSLIVLIIKPVVGVLGIVGGIFAILYGRKMKRLRDGSKT